MILQPLTEAIARDEYASLVLRTSWGLNPELVPLRNELYKLIMRYNDARETTQGHQRSTKEGLKMTYTHIPSSRECEIVAAVQDSTDPHPTNDWYRAKFSDGSEIVAAPEDFDPIPKVGAAR